VNTITWRGPDGKMQVRLDPVPPMPPELKDAIAAEGGGALPEEFEVSGTALSGRGILWGRFPRPLAWADRTTPSGSKTKPGRPERPLPSAQANGLGNGGRPGVRTHDRGSLSMPTATFRIWRGDATKGEFRDYTAEVGEGMVVLDAVHQIQGHAGPGPRLPVGTARPGKCGSCSAEINGVPKLMCMTRMSEPAGRPAVIVEPMQAFPPVKDLVTDDVVELRGEEEDRPVQAAGRRTPRRHLADEAGGRRPGAGFPQVHRVLLCRTSATCLRDHHKHDEFIGPRSLVYAASLR